MSQYIASQWDYIYLLLGLSFVFIGMICASIAQSAPRSLPWMHLGMFAITQGLITWLDLYALVVKGSTLLLDTRFGLSIISYMFLWEFARIGFGSQQKRPRYRLLLLPLFVVLMATAGVAAVGYEVTNIFIGYVIALPACLWASSVLAREAVAREGRGGRTLLIAAGALIFYGLLVGVVAPQSMRPPMPWSDQDIFYNWAGVPNQVIVMIMAMAMGGSLYNYAMAAVIPDYISTELKRDYRRTALITISAVTLSAILCNELGYSMADQGVYRLSFIWATLMACLLAIGHNVTLVKQKNVMFNQENSKEEGRRSVRRSKPIDLGVVSISAWIVDVIVIAISGVIGAQTAEEIAHLHLIEHELILSIGMAIGIFVYITQSSSYYHSSNIVPRHYVSSVVRAVAAQYSAICVIGVIYIVPVDGHIADFIPVFVWLFWWGLFCTLFTMLTSFGLHGLVESWKAGGQTAQQIAIIGLGEPTSRLLEWMRRDMPDLVQIVGIFDDRSERAGTDQKLRDLYRGTTDDLIALSRDQHIDSVVLALPHAAEGRLLDLLFKLKPMAAQITLGPDLMGFRLPDSRAKTVEMAGLPLLHIGPTPLRASQSYLKELFDRSFALVALILLWPILLAAAIAIKLDSPGPVFFMQDRYGYGNKIIKVFKFRSMRTEMSDFGAVRQTERNDPRVTRVGNFLRKSSIDELPQLINVLKGDMSIVGPRPMTLQMRVHDKLNHEIVSEYAHRHRLKPGLTGWAQVNGLRGAISTEEHLRARVEHDLYYIDNWSLWFDIRIILMTFRVLLGHDNAY
jgi:Undecaprenyl-phosphate glucose phosphotransferase